MLKVVNFKDKVQVNLVLVDFLWVLLKVKIEKFGVVFKLIVFMLDLDCLVLGEWDVFVLLGWCCEVFGEDVLWFCDGQIVLIVKGLNIKIIKFQSSLVVGLEGFICVNYVDCVYVF